MDDRKKRVLDMMGKLRRESRLPSSVGIVSETLQLLGYGRSAIKPDYVLNNFERLLRQLFDETLPTLERHEWRTYAEGIPRGLIDETPDVVEESMRLAARKGFREASVRLFREWYPMLRIAFQSIDQSRKTRGGKDFELQIEGLLSLARVPFVPQTVHYRTDLLLPNMETFARNRNAAVIISVKRTLRERWREVAEELQQLRSPNVFLFTADENITDGHIERICKTYHIYLVVWDSVKTDRFADEPEVLGYTQWATERLPLLRAHWQ